MRRPDVLPGSAAVPAVLKAAFVGGLLAVAAAGPATAADAAAGKRKAQMCSACHGDNGVSVTPDAPNLAAQPAVYLVSALRAYRDGGRKHEVMSLMAKPLADGDIDDLAAWFSSIAIEAKLKAGS